MNDESGIKISCPAVNVAVVKKDSDGWKFLVLKRSEEVTYSGHWGILTGRKKDDETAAQVTVREMKEEISIVPKSIWATEHLVQFYEPEDESIWILPYIVAVVDADSQVILSNENSEYRWLDPSKAKNLVSWKNLIKATDEVSQELGHFPASNWVQIKP